MKKVLTIVVAITAFVCHAQIPQKMSYQAVVRNAQGQLVKNQPVGVQFSIHHESEGGQVVFTQEQTVTTNENGLLNTEIGDSGLEGIDWADGPYFLSCEIDPEGGTNYSISGTSQLISVPYAFYATTAETLSGDIEETDPVFAASAAGEITSNDMDSWNNKLEDETDPLFSEWSASGGYANGDSIVLRDSSGVVRFVMNPNTGTFKMMNHDTVWYQMAVQSPLSRLVHNSDGSTTRYDGSNKYTYRSDGTLAYSSEGIIGSLTEKTFDTNGQVRSEHTQHLSVGGTEVMTDVTKKFNSDGSLSEEITTMECSSMDDTDTRTEESHKKYDSTGKVVEEIKSTYKNGKLTSREYYQNGVKVYEENANAYHGYTSSWNQSGLQSWTMDQTYKSTGYSQMFQTQGYEDPFGIQFQSTGGQPYFTITSPNSQISGNFNVEGNSNFNGVFSANNSALFNHGFSSLGGAEFYNNGSQRADLFTEGSVYAQGSLNAQGSKNFKIDHPLEPDKYLQHASIESNEVLNQYSGNVVTSNTGKAVVQLPAYFEAINTDYRYQLTVIGTFAQAIVSKKIENNQFEIQTNDPNVEVSWQVTAKRSDSYMQENPFNAEPVK